MLKISNFKIKNSLVLAPMAGFTDYAFRHIACELGAGMTVSEMVNVKGLVHDDKKTLDLTKRIKDEAIYAVQIFGSDEDDYKRAIEDHLNAMDIDIIDINMGCPMPKITKNGDGSALLRDTEKVYSVVKAAKSASTKPITVKIRIGWDDEHLNGVENAKAIEEAGADAITVHGRTREAFYTGRANWDYIKKIASAVDIPVIANGDVASLDDYIKILEVTGAEGVAIGRGALANPFLFKEIDSYLKGEEYISEEYQKIDVALRHMDLDLELYPKELLKNNMKKQLLQYIKGLRNAAKVKNAICESKDFDEIYEILLKYRENLKNNTYV